MIHDDVAAMLAGRIATVPTRAGLERRLTHIFGGLLELHVSRPALALRFLRRIPSLTDNAAGAHESLNGAIVVAIRTELDRGMRRGEIREDLDCSVAAFNVFAVFRIRVFEWLASPGCDVESGTHALRASVAQLIDGLRGR